MEKDKKKPLFIHQPEYKGGPKALTQFIYAQLRYPAAALEAGVEGMVLVDYDIDYKGNVVATRVLQGVGHGCDEEACRVVRLLKFDVPKNRGVRVLFHKKARIQFKKPAPVAQPAAPNSSPAALQVSYSLTPAETPAETVAENKKEVYSYTIQL
ncbi:MAG: energy transducer TonB [Saprospiraceae bacterium]|nr:energy transducer TonB [Saprospiraceae bacterium]